MDVRDVVEGDCLGVSLGEPAAVEGAESSVVAVTVRFRSLRWGIAVEAIVVIAGEFSAAETIELSFKQWMRLRYIRVVVELEKVQKSREVFVVELSRRLLYWNPATVRRPSANLFPIESSSQLKNTLY
jgi:hypothetical protein